MIGCTGQVEFPFPGSLTSTLRNQVVDGTMTVGQWVMIQTYLLQLAQPLAWLGTAWRVIQQVPIRHLFYWSFPVCFLGHLFSFIFLVVYFLGHSFGHLFSWSVCDLLITYLLGQLCRYLVF